MALRHILKSKRNRGGHLSMSDPDFLSDISEAAYLKEAASSDKLKIGELVQILLIIII